MCVLSIFTSTFRDQILLEKVKLLLIDILDIWRRRSSFQCLIHIIYMALPCALLKELNRTELVLDLLHAIPTGQGGNQITTVRRCVCRTICLSPEKSLEVNLSAPFFSNRYSFCPIFILNLLVTEDKKKK